MNSYISDWKYNHKVSFPKYQKMLGKFVICSKVENSFWLYDSPYFKYLNCRIETNLNNLKFDDINFYEIRKGEILNKLNSKLIKKINSGLITLVINNLTEIDTQYNFNRYKYRMERAGINTDNVILLDGNQNKFGDSHMRFNWVLCKFKFANWEFYNDSYFNSDNYIKPKTFLSFNRRPSHTRLYLVYQLLKNKLNLESYISLCGDMGEIYDHTIKEICNFMGEEISDDEIKNFLGDIPLFLDITTDGVQLDTGNLIDTTGEDTSHFSFIKDTYFWVTTETTFGCKFHYANSIKYDDDGEYYNVIYPTEKTYKSIMSNPTIIVGDPGILGHLHQLGFKTFPDFFDERYDEIVDDKKRMNFIINDIKRIYNLPKNELHRKWSDNISNVKHNLEIMENISVDDLYLEFYTKIFNRVVEFKNKINN